MLPSPECSGRRLVGVDCTWSPSYRRWTIPQTAHKQSLEQKTESTTSLLGCKHTVFTIWQRFTVQSLIRSRRVDIINEQRSDTQMQRWGAAVRCFKFQTAKNQKSINSGGRFPPWRVAAGETAAALFLFGRGNHSVNMYTVRNLDHFLTTDQLYFAARLHERFASQKEQVILGKICVNSTNLEED